MVFKFVSVCLMLIGEQHFFILRRFSKKYLEKDCRRNGKLYITKIINQAIMKHFRLEK